MSAIFNLTRYALNSRENSTSLVLTLRCVRLNLDPARFDRTSRDNTQKTRRCHRQADLVDLFAVGIISAKAARSVRGDKTVTIMLIAGVSGWEIRVKYLSRTKPSSGRASPRAARHTIISRHLLNKQTDGRLFLVYFRPAVCAKISCRLD